MLKFASLSVFLLTLLQTVLLASVNNFENLEDSSVNFAVDLYKNVLNYEENQNKNFAVSPFSIEKLLQLLYNGASGNTAEELSKTLKLQDNTNRNVLNNYVKQNINHYNNDQCIKIVNKIYVNDEDNLKETFKNVAKNYYNSEIESISFNDKTVAANKMNDWVKTETNGKIDKLIDSNDLSNEIKSVLLNAVHFKAKWLNKFHKSSTLKKPFWLTPKKSIDIDIMSHSGRYLYNKLPELDATALQLNYHNTDISLLIILPNKYDGLNVLENNLQNHNLLDIASKLQDEAVRLSLPKFKIEMELDLFKILQNMGLKDIFGDNSNLDNIIENKVLKVSKAIHKTFIEFNEDGTEAAAATVHKAVPVSSSFRRHIFKVNHPFLYVLMSNSTIFFIGRQIEF